jgi:hypothetical protein
LQYPLTLRLLPMLCFVQIESPSSEELLGVWRITHIRSNDKQQQGV